MRLLRLDLGTGHTIDLHPFVTLVTELSDAQCDEVVAAVRTLSEGSTAGVRGLVQHQGLLIELDGSMNERLLAATGADVAIDGQALIGADLNWLRDRIDLQRRRAEIAAVRVEEIRADLRPSARAELCALERRLDALGHDAHGAGPARRRLEAALAALSVVAPHLESAPDGVAELRARLADHEREMEAASAHLRRLDTMMERAQAGMMAARTAVDKAEVDARPALLSREQEARLEQLSFPSMDESRKGRWRKQLRPEEQTEMDELLAIVGVDSWTAYTMYRTSPTVSPAKTATLTEARAGLADAEEQLSEAQLRSEQDPARTALMHQEEQLRDEARKFLGMMLPNDIDPALAELTVRSHNPAWAPAVDELARALHDYGVGVDPSSDPASLVEAAGRALEDHGEEFAARDELVAEWEEARTVLAGHRRALARLEQAEAAAAQAAIGLANLEEQLATSGADDATGVDAVLARIQPIATQVALEGNGSLPVVLFGELPVSADTEVERLMAKLSELSDHIQVIVVSGRTAVADWANGVGLDRAMVSGMKTKLHPLPF